MKGSGNNWKSGDTGTYGEGALSFHPRSVRWNFSWVLAGNVVMALSQWFALVVVARFTSVQGVGQYALGMAVATPVFMFTGLNLAAVQSTDANGRHEFHTYVLVRRIGACVGLTTLAGLALTLHGYSTTALIIVLVGVVKAVEGFSDVRYGTFQRFERMEHTATSLVIRALAGYGAFTLSLALTTSLPVALGALAAVWGLVFALHDRPRARILQGNLQPLEGCPARPDVGRPVWVLIRHALPLGLVAALSALGTYIPLYWLEFMGGTEVVGLFAAGVYLLRAGDIVVAALARAASPKLANHFAGGRLSAYLKLLGKLIGVAVALGAGGVVVATVAGEDLLKVLYGFSAPRSHAFLVLLVLAAAINYVWSFLGTALTAAHKFRVQGAVHTGRVVLMGAAGYPLVGSWHELGAAGLLLLGGVYGGAVYALILHRLISRPVLHGVGLPLSTDPRG